MESTGTKTKYALIVYQQMLVDNSKRLLAQQDFQRIPLEKTNQDTTLKTA